MKKKPAFQLMIKPIGPVCNLSCDYCYYLEKEELYREKLDLPARFAMSPEVLDKCIRDYFVSQNAVDILFTWQGGEPTMLGIDFFKKAIEIQKQYADGRRVSNSIQTNGTLINGEWAEFLAKNNFLVGLSIDGPSDLHDYYRTLSSGDGTFGRVMKGVDLLRRYHVEFNTITTVNNRNSRSPLRVYRFLKDIGSRYMQFIPIVERESTGIDGTVNLVGIDHDGEASVTEESVGSLTWGKFLSGIFDEWVRLDIGRYYVNYFDNTLATYIGEEPSLCTTRQVCGDNLVLEHNGDLYSCDHYVYPRYLLGNIKNRKLDDLTGMQFQMDYGQDKKNTLPNECLECKFLKMCGGDCPKHRFVENGEGKMISYLHEGFLHFFGHADQYMKMMAVELRQQKSPENIMRTFPKRERQKLLKQMKSGNR